MGSSPMVRLIEPDGTVLAEIRTQDVAKGILHQAVLDRAAVIGKAAESKLQAMSASYPKALHAEPYLIPVAADIEKMRQNGLGALERSGAAAPDVEVFTALCQCCSGSRAARTRELASFAKSLRACPEPLPLMDLARRLAAKKALGGGEPGAREALELLLDAAICRGMHDETADLTRASLALQLLSNCYVLNDLREALLPMTGQLVTTSAWIAAWRQVGAAAAGASGAVTRFLDAASALILNASVALRTARCRSEHGGLLAAGVAALQISPQNERINLAVGNLLAVGPSRCGEACASGAAFATFALPGSCSLQG